MPTYSSERIVEHLRETNLRLDFWLDSLTPGPGPAHDPALSSYIRPHQMAGLLSELMLAGEWLRELPAQREAELEQALGEYRRKVERLRDLMPAMHATLLRQRDRLEQEQGRMESAVEWARRSRQTL